MISWAGMLPSIRNDPAVRVLDLGATLFKLLDAHIYALQNIERLEARDNNGYVVFPGYRFVLGVAHDSADVPRCQEALHTATR